MRIDLAGRSAPYGNAAAFFATVAASIAVDAAFFAIAAFRDGSAVPVAAALPF
jgi:hypothetical protein